MRTWFLLLLIVLMIPLASLISVSPARASAGDVYFRFDSFQMYAPAKLQLQFAFTRNANAKCIPVGFSTQFTCNTGTDKLYFEGNENDTYIVRFFASYDVPIFQNITLTIQEGSRPPIAKTIVMSGTIIDIEWTAIQVVPEPNPPTKEEIGNYITNGVIAQQKENNAVTERNTTSINALWIVLVIIAVELNVVLVVSHRKTSARLRGGVP